MSGLKIDESDKEFSEKQQEMNGFEAGGGGDLKG
uniref:Uncharacterized protein n=1 Tax=Nelumbo nucifera TaxID=4432 RepID=A0A822XIK9_NELNU|nr:TPA_asm: hypothetical protein HUJ06_021006 [Nelumbo nucifera]